MRAQRVKTEGGSNPLGATPRRDRTQGTTKAAARHGGIPLLGLVAILVVALLSAAPMVAAEDEVDKVERRTGTSGEETLDKIERKFESGDGTDDENDDESSAEKILRKAGLDESDENETQDPQEPGEANDTVGEDEPSNGSREGSGSESGKQTPSRNNGTDKDTARDVAGIELECRPNPSLDPCGSHTDQEPQSPSQEKDTDQETWWESPVPSHRPAQAPSSNDDGEGGKAATKDDKLAKTASGSGIVMVLAWTLFVASTGPLGRSGKSGQKRQQPTLQLTPESERKAQESESRPKAQNQQAPQRNR